MNWINIKLILKLIINKLINSPINRANYLNIRYNITILLYVFEDLFLNKFKSLKDKQIHYYNYILNNNKLIKLNSTSNKYIAYNFNRYELLKNMLISRLTSKLIYDLIYKIFYNNINKSSRFINNYVYLVISKPKVKINLSNVKISFYYYLPSYKPNLFINRTLLYLNNNNPKLAQSTLSKGKLDNLKYSFISNIINNIFELRNNKHLSENLNNIINKKSNNIYSSSLYNLIAYRLKFRVLNHNINNDLTRYYIKNLLTNIYSSVNIVKNKKGHGNLLPVSIYNNILNDIPQENNWLYSGYTNLDTKKRIYKILLNRGNKDLILSNTKYISNNTNMDSNLVIKRAFHNSSDNKPNYLQLIVFSINKLFNQLNGNNNINNKSIINVNKLSNILSKFFNNKKVIINPIHLKYEYNNTDILMRILSNSIDDENDRDIDRKFRKILLNRKLVLNDSKRILNTIKENKLVSISNRDNIYDNQLDYQKELNVNNSIDNISKESIRDILLPNMNINLSDNITNKYLVGTKFEYNGKYGSSWGKRRSNKYSYNKGTFRNYLIEYNQVKNSSYNLNYIKPGVSKGYIGKHTFSGKVGIKLTLNRI
ncbi:ribosomal protein S3 (mitochondrion) [Ogataea philodendri]|uniref:Small ribosomal subunit protein uS3m n=1 Tax=Ogataea philodendri TaxID=1378263 RepID=S5TEU4_9ASCO|nr:ribosomal protein S3 [Ogataea philodendri]AGS44394.1 ribosomal protein S3 [Ogataea philodendri]